MSYRFLDKIDSPADLRNLSSDKLEEVSTELRHFIIDVLSNNPGHFAASLGVVELTVALHYVYNTPYDRIVWDVGHQAYGHKILTGRRDIFHTNRKFGGLSGFPNPNESEYDTFVAGHASTSISAALGMAVASNINKEYDKHVVAVIGDGSMTGGMAYEGLNNASINPNKLLIILNDNQMAIDDNVGGLSEYLVNLTTSQAYNKLRYDVYRLLRKLKLINNDRKDSIIRFNNSLKSLITGQHNLFEGLNIRYFGPVDGHDVNQMIKVLNDIKDLNGPKILHVITKKGKGFEPAEKSATEWHAPGIFNKETGERLVKKSLNEPPLYQDVFGYTLVELAEKNNKIVGVTPAMPSGCSMTFMMQKMPNRSFDVGIAEAHAVTFSAGMAKEGLMPFCNVYSSFMQRAYDQIIHDVALQKINMVMCLDRSGLVGEDGPTHHGVFDIPYLRCVPNLTIASPMNEHELRNLMFTAQRPNMGPFVIRYPRGKGVCIDWESEMKELPVGKGRCISEGESIAVLSIGHIGNDTATAIIKAKAEGLNVAHYDLVFVKPLDEELLHTICKKFKKIITVESGVLKGGFGSAILEFMSDNNYAIPVKRIGIQDQFIEQGSVPELNKLCNIDVDGIYNQLLEFSKL
ncbi:MAG: 1-deoxy-D-xylulose-5-phosphate synthase [Bacteroidales bacterium]